MKKLQGGYPCISVGISGDTLALVITYHSDPPHPEDNVYIFDWKAGVLKMVSPTEYHLPYCDLTNP